MKIQIQNGDHSFRILLPTGLIFNPFTIGLALRSGSADGITLEAANRLARECKRIRKKYGTWNLVEIQDADGQQVTITL